MRCIGHYIHGPRDPRRASRAQSNSVRASAVEALTQGLKEVCSAADSTLQLPRVSPIVEGLEYGEGLIHRPHCEHIGIIFPKDEFDF